MKQAVRKNPVPVGTFLTIDLAIRLDLGAPGRALTRAVSSVSLRYHTWRSRRAIARFRAARRECVRHELDWRPLLTAADNDELLTPDERRGLWVDYWRGDRRLRDREKAATEHMWHWCARASEAQECATVEGVRG